MDNGEGWNSVTDEDFDAKVMKSGSPVLVELRAEWCGACHILDPIINEVTRSFEGRAEVLRMDADISCSTVHRYGVQKLPALLFFNRGQLAEIIQGTVPGTRIVTTLERLIGSDHPPVGRPDR
jgi:thioredoxin 1